MEQDFLRGCSTNLIVMIYIYVRFVFIFAVTFYRFRSTVNNKSKGSVGWRLPLFILTLSYHCFSLRRGCNNYICLYDQGPL